MAAPARPTPLPSPDPPPADRAPGEPGAPVLLLAVTAGIVVANLYYAQPLLPAIAASLGVPEPRVAVVATLTQLGYAAGLLLVVPLADVAERRRLIVTLSLLAAGMLAAAAAAPGLGALAVASLWVGVCSVVPQVVIPVAATLAAPERRGKAVGTVMSGLLVGILLARVASGALGARLGWRAVFAAAAGLMTLLALVLRLRLPASRPDAAIGYAALLRSLPGLVRRHPPLRTAALVSGCAFASFSAFWTTLAFHLAAPPLGLGSAAAGAFGLVGAVGALAASVVGRLTDRGAPGSAVRWGLLIGLAGWLVLGAWGGSVLGLAAGVIVLDLGMQGTHVPNQALVFGLDPAARGRLNALYMVTAFVGAAAGSAAGAAAWAHGRWPGVVALGGACLLLAAAASAHGRRRDRRAAAALSPAG